MNISEQLLSTFAEMYFFKEFVQEDLCYIPHGDTEHELADLLINLGDIIIAIQFKSRDRSIQTTNQGKELKWLTNKCKEAKAQIKKTLQDISSGNTLSFLNKRGQAVVVDCDAEIIPLVIFDDSSIKDYPRLLQKHSPDGLTVNCMSLTDFRKMCSELITPAEIFDYLIYRKSFYEQNGQVNLAMYFDEGEDLMLVHPAKNEGLMHQFLAEKYGIAKASEGTDKYEIFRDFLHAIPDHAITEGSADETYSILLFLAHFHRNEIFEFLKRLLLARDESKKGNYTIVGSLRLADDKYAIFFCAAKPYCRLPMDYLLELARKKSNPKMLLEVSVYWESDETFRIDWFFWDSKI